MPLFHLLFLLSLPLSLLSSSSPFGIQYSIDCGGSKNFTSPPPLSRQWLSDRFFSGAGAAAFLPDPHHFPLPQQPSLRFFPPSSNGLKNCYSLPTAAANGRYYIRLFTIYDNYDAKLRPPSFDVAVGSTPVFSFRSPWPDSVARSGAYSDFIAGGAEAIDLCFHSIATDPPVVSSIELYQIDPLAYASEDHVLVNYGRLSCGSSELFGPGFSVDDDAFGRFWQPDAVFRNPNVRVKAVTPSGGRRVLGSNQPHDYVPAKLFEAAVTTVWRGDYLEYMFPVDGGMDYVVWFYFVEID